MMIDDRLRQRMLDGLHAMVLVLSVLLIVFISVDTFKRIPFFVSRRYMTFQLWVCMAFIFDFFAELALTPRGSRWRYVGHRWIFLMLSVPYLNIIHRAGIAISDEAFFFIRLVPVARGVLALVIVLGYISAYRITNILASYISVMLLAGYFGCIVFFECEESVNPAVTDYWDAFWWGSMQMTTLGCQIYPVTVIGKAVSAVLSVMGMIMFPLFTVYLTNVITRTRQRRKSGGDSVTQETALRHKKADN